MSSSRFGGRTTQHDEFREWAAAELGDPRQVYARKAGAPLEDPLVFMPDGEADRFREAARSGALICPVPKCPAPELHTRGPADRRHHFVHDNSPGGDAHKRKYIRIATEHLLRDWAEAQNQVVAVQRLKIEMDGVSFILWVRLDDGSELALCYVDQRLGTDAWDEHNRLMRSRGLSTVWIFALRKMYFAHPEPAGPADADAGRNDLILDRLIYKRMRRKGSWPLLIHLEREELGNVIKPWGRPAKNLRLAPPASDRVQHLEISALAKARLCPYGIATRAIGERTLEAGHGNWNRY